jgi:hypothetical protein
MASSFASSTLFISTAFSFSFLLILNLNALDNRIKTVKEYNQEIELLKAKVTEIQKSIALINGSKERSLKNLNVNKYLRLL